MDTKADMNRACCAGHSHDHTPVAASPAVDSAAVHAAHVLRLWIPQMDCPNEEALIRRALEKHPGVAALEFDLMNRVLRVHHDLDDADPLIEQLHAIGMYPEESGSADQTETTLPSSNRHAWWLAGIAGVFALGAEVVAYVTGDEQSLPVILMALLAIALGGRDTLRSGWTALRTFTLNINLLMSVAVIGAVLIGQWPEAAVVIWLFGIAELIEAASLERARDAIRSLMNLAPETAQVQQGETWVDLRADQVPVGALVRARPGERIALDGVIVRGQSSINQAPITGESMPVDKQPGDVLYAGTINEQGVLEYRVTAAKGETMLDRIARSVQEAQGQRAPTQRFVDRFARVYTPVVFLIAIAVAALPPLLDGDWYGWFYKALVLLVIACPCALVISTPVTVVSGLAAAARRGIVVKGGLYLEQGRHLKFMAFDKTGTLTHGRPVLTDVVPLAGRDRAEVLRIAASLEAHSTHPVARAIVAAAGADRLAEVTDFESLTGQGLRGEIDGTTWFLGSHRLIETLQLSDPSLEALLDRLEEEAKTAIVLATRTEAVAVLAVADSVRDMSGAVVHELQALGITPLMLTGDNRRTAETIAAQVGIDIVHSELLPEDKLSVIENYSRRGPIGMVGDGVNDAPALARADIGFAMGGEGTDTAIETADVALLRDDLRRLVEFIRLSRRTSHILWQNITLALGIKFVFFALTLMGSATLWMAVFADMGATLIVVFNGLRLLRDKREPVHAMPTPVATA